jgi:DNA-binding LacI/PurR family transcriptional regulator
LERIGVPVVLINNHNRQSGRYTFSVSVDNQHGGHLATAHLVQRGHRRIGYVSGPADHSDDAERLAGYCQALDEAGIPFDPALAMPGNGRLDGGGRALHALAALADPPTAVFCYNDMTAIGLISAARQARLSVPEDLAVVGFDDIPLAAHVHPALTTVAQPQRDMGRQAMGMALALMTADDAATSLSDVVIRGRLVVRESSGVENSAV